METKASRLFVHGTEVQAETVDHGVVRRILGYDNNLMMTHVTFEKGAVGAIHRHEHRQVTYVESGSFEVRIGNEQRVLKAGDCYFIPSHVDHGVVALEPGSLVDVFTPARADFLEKTP